MERRFTLGLLLGAFAFAGVAVLAQSAPAALPEEIAGYLRWERANADRSFEESAHPVAKDIYLNEPAAASVAEGGFPHGEGSVLVKESTDPATLQVTVLTTMRKVEGFNPDGGDWQYGRFDRADDGGITGGWLDVEGAAMCMGCHADAAETDYTFLSYLDR